MSTSILNLDAFANVEAEPNLYICTYNKHSAHVLGKQASCIYDDSLNKMYDLFPYYDHIEFIPGGGTQANKRAIIGSISSKPKFISQGKRRNIILLSSIEHTSILVHIASYLKDHEYIVALIPCDTDGVISASKLNELLETHGETVALVSVMNVNNETGIIQNLHTYLEIVSKYPDIIFHSDMAQGIQLFYHNINKYNLLPDIVTFSGYKLGVPNFGIVLSRVKLHDDYFGTVDVSGISHLVNVISQRFANQSYMTDSSIKKYLTSQLEKQLATHNVKYIIFSGESTVNNAVSLLLFGYQSSMIQQLLSAENICIGTGSACASVNKSDIGSHVIKEMGYVDSVTYNLIRLTWINVNMQQIDRFVNTLIKIVNKLKPLITIPNVIMSKKLISRTKSQDLKHEIETSKQEADDSIKYKFKISIGESYLKGTNRNIFINFLIDDIKYRLKKNNMYTDKTIYNDRIHITLHCQGLCGINKYVSILKTIPGISFISFVKYFKNKQSDTFESLLEKIYAIISSEYNEGDKICIRSKIHDKNIFQYSNTDLNVIIGQMLVDRRNAPVDLNNPDIKIDISFYPHTIEISTQRYKGLSGLPLKSEGIMNVIVNKNNMLRTIYVCIKLSIRGIILNIVNKDGCDLSQLFEIVSEFNPYITNINECKKTEITICETNDFNHIIEDRNIMSMTTHISQNDLITYLKNYNVNISDNIVEVNNTVNRGFLSMISGGIDSPVSSNTINKYAKSRNLRSVLVHFATTIDKINVIKSIRDKLKIAELIVVEFQNLQFAIAEKCPENYRTILFKLFMVKISNEIAKREGLDIIVMGNAIGQVASQTYENLVATNQISELPIYNPLFASSKDDIINEARSINTYDDSICTGTNDCCTMFLPRHPVLKADVNIVNKYFNQFENFMDLVKIHKI